MGGREGGPCPHHRLPIATRIHANYDLVSWVVFPAVGYNFFSGALIDKKAAAAAMIGLHPFSVNTTLYEKLLKGGILGDKTSLLFLQQRFVRSIFSPHFHRFRLTFESVY